METAEQFVDLNEMARRVVYAVESVLFLFFVISPIIGYLIARTIAKRVNQVMVWGVMFLLINLCANGGYLYLRDRIPIERLPDPSLVALMIVAAIAIAMLIGRYLAWYLEPPAQSELQREFEDMTEDQMSPVDIRRKEEMERRRRLRG